MQIVELTKTESLDLLGRTRLGRLACTRGLQPYVVPHFFAYRDSYLYSFSTVGQKIEWMRQNPLVCIEADEIVSPDEWKCVVIEGTYEELPERPEPGCACLRDLAYQLLKQQGHADFWQPAFVKTILHGKERPLVPIYFRIAIAKITGHRAISSSDLAAGPATA